MTLDPIASALLAVLATDDGEPAAAQAHIATAQQQSRATARRQRQIVEIAALVVAGHRQRAAGLAFVHAAEFPDDEALPTRVAGPLL